MLERLSNDLQMDPRSCDLEKFCKVMATNFVLGLLQSFVKWTIFSCALVPFVMQDPVKFVGVGVGVGEGRFPPLVTVQMLAFGDSPDACPRRKICYVKHSLSRIL